MNPVVRMKELVIILNQADFMYYGKDQSIMPDSKYDALFDELVSLEKEAGVILSDSPTKKVSGWVSKELEKVEHTRPMLSARKTKRKEEFFQFISGKEVVISRKMDGLTLVLRYEDGKLVRALTRGENGITGEDVTHTVKKIRNVPLEIQEKGKVEVRGEGVISLLDYQILQGNEKEGHPRHKAAGLVRSKEVDVSALSHMDFFAFDLIEGPRFETKSEELDFLFLSGFDIVENETLPGTINEDSFYEILQTFNKESADYPVDGVILEYNSKSYAKSLGVTKRYENRMLAYKWEDEENETTFRKVECSVNTNGLVSLVAVFDPVKIDGEYVERAALSSYTHFEKMQFGKGDKLSVIKSNMIIPKITENKTKSGTYELLKYCPHCMSELKEIETDTCVKNLYCQNERCSGRLLKRLSRFVSKDAMNMPSFTNALLIKMISYGILTSYVDFFHLEEKKEDLLLLERVNYDTYERLLKETKRSRDSSFSAILSGMNIPHLSREKSEVLSEYFYGDPKKFEKALKEDFDFNHIAGISTVLNRNIKSWYQNESEQKQYQLLLKELQLL